MLTSNSLLLSSNNQKDYYPPSPPLSSIPDSHMSKTWCQSKLNTSAEPSAFLNLEKVVQTYGSQPELLELILSSKVEEDRRRAEEAKLRRKEIEYMLHQQTQAQAQKNHQEGKSSKTSSFSPISSNQSSHRLSSFSSANSVGSAEPTSLPRLQYHRNYSTTPHFFNKTNSPKRKNSSNIEMLLLPSPKSLELKLPELSIAPSTSPIKNQNILK